MKWFIVSCLAEFILLTKKNVTDQTCNGTDVIHISDYYIFMIINFLIGDQHNFNKSTLFYEQEVVKWCVNELEFESQTSN